MHTEEFLQIVGEMFPDSKPDQKKIAAALGLSQASVSNFLRGVQISKRSEKKIREAYDAFSMNGTLRTDPDDGERPFVEETWARDRTSGRLYPMSKVEAGLVGNFGGKPETDEEIAVRLAKRFDILDRMVHGVVEGVVPSMIVFGAPGVGKSFNIMRELEGSGVDYDLVKGACTAPGLYMALWNQRKGGVVVLDDADGLFRDEDALNLLKSALDSTDKRVLAWRKQSSWVTEADEEDDEGRVPNNFEFKGSVIFITNIDFEEMIARESKMSEHFKALMSRSLYLNLTLKTARDKLVRIKQVFLGPMRKREGLEIHEAEEIMAYVEENAVKWLELSLRLMKHLSQLYKLGQDWREIAQVTKMKH